MKEFEFRGQPFKIECLETFPSHPTWFTFIDEACVRDRDWDIQPGDVVCDIGAAYGSYTLTALAVGASHVYAWSPQGPPDEEPERVILAKSLALNGWTEKCDVYASGVFDRSGWLNASTQVFSTTEPEPDNEVIRVERLDDWFYRTKPERIDWLKLDVEGAEVEVLQGAVELIHATRPRVLVENHSFKRPTVADEVREFLIGCGYREVSTVQHHSVSHSLYVP